MTRDALLAMPDQALFAALGAALDAKFDDEEVLVGPEIAVYAAWVFDAEVHVGGLREFLINEFSDVAALVPSALLSMDAVEHEALLAHFLDETGLDLEDPSRAYEARYQEAYAEFDDAYSALPALSGLAAAYIRAHADVFSE